jgi:hypothetical protein
MLWALAQQAYLAHEYQKAAAFLECLVAFGRTGGYDRSVSFDPGIIAETAVLNLGKCFVQMGNLNRAEACFSSLLASPEHKKEATDNLRLIQNLRAKSKPASPPRLSGWNDGS